MAKPLNYSGISSHQGLQKKAAFFSEDFESVTPPALPAGWTTSTLGTDGGFFTGDYQDANAGTYWPVADHTQFVMTNDDVCNCDKSADYLELPQLDFTGQSGFSLAFEYVDDRSYGGNPSTVELNINGAGWNVLYTLPQTTLSWDYVNIPLTVADNQPDVRIRFHYDDASEWATGLAIDDVVIDIPPDNDLAIKTIYYDTLGAPLNIPDSMSTLYYYQIPLKQAMADSIFFSCNVFNKGAATQSNTRLFVDITGAETYIDSSSAISLAPAATDALMIAAPYTPSVLGTHNVAFEVLSDSTDAFPDDNIRSDYFEVTNSIYARDDGIFAQIAVWWYGTGVNYEIGNMFEIFTIDTAYSISYYNKTNVSSNIGVPGNIISLNLYDETGFGTFTPIASNQYYVISPLDTNTWITLPIPPTELVPGQYIVMLETISGDQVFVTSQTAPPLTVFIDPDNSNTTWYYADKIPWIRLNFSLYTSFLPNMVKGTVFNDLNSDCTADSAESGLLWWMVRADPGPYYAFTDYSGNYRLYLDSGNYTISLIDNELLWNQVCPLSPSTYSVNLTDGDTINNINFGIQADYYCPDMSVDISTWAVRPCFSSTYSVNYCNNGTMVAINATIDVELDGNMSYTGGTGNLISQNGNILTFDIGTVNSGQCGTFHFFIDVTCDMSLVGSTMCVEAHIYPDSICTPPDSAWDHSSVSVVGKCVGDSLACFTIYNTGDPGTGDMQGTSEYRIYENNMLVYSGTFQLNGGDSTVICWPANSNTIRLEADQRPGHPGNSHPQDNVELCGVPTFVTWQITVVPEDDEDDFIEIDCNVVTGSYDPNDKQVKPEGLTEQYRYIDSTDVLEYLIRFQNTGTDTAFNVVIWDTLSEYLDITTINTGSSSHPYSFDIYGNDIIQFTFNSILLPDSNVNEPQSHGFVKFKIHQQPGNTKGTVIENKAGIVFDFNEPVITNTVFNTIGNIDSVTCYIEASFSYQGADLTVNFTSASSNADSYSWDFGDGSTSIEQNPAYTYSDTGTYTVTLTVSNSCGSDTYNQTVTVQSTGIYHTGYSGYQISVFPNPFNSSATIIITGRNVKESLSFELYNIIGERVKVISITGNKFVVRRENLPEGMYLYKITSFDELISVGKLVVD
ncbi:MAG: PKD domain-containing protein [Bacteroidota bacterium]